MKTRIKFLCSVSLVLIASFAFADDVYQFATPAKEQQFYRITQNSRCLVCQNESLADSSAPLAVDLRDDIYKMVTSGQTDAEIQKYLEKRYGSFVLYKPPLHSATMLLWFGPFGLLLAGLLGLLWYLRTTKQADESDELSDADKAKLEQLLGEQQEGGKQC